MGEGRRREDGGDEMGEGMRKEDGGEEIAEREIWRGDKGDENRTEKRMRE